MTDPLVALRRAAAACWPAIDTARIGDWTLRASGGFTGRANSVLATGDLGCEVERGLQVIRRFYAERGLPALAQVAVGSSADILLRVHGWVEARPDEADGRLMTRSLGAEWPHRWLDGSPVSQRSGGQAPVRWQVSRELTEAWVRVAYPDGLPAAADMVLTGGSAVFALAVDVEAGGPVGAARGGHYGDVVGLACLRVAEAFRRRGLATGLLASVLRWGHDQGATEAFLEVLDDNTGARALYRRCGFTDRFAYRYLTPGPD